MELVHDTADLGLGNRFLKRVLCQYSVPTGTLWKGFHGLARVSLSTFPTTRNQGLLAPRIPAPGSTKVYSTFSASPKPHKMAFSAGLSLFSTASLPHVLCHTLTSTHCKTSDLVHTSQERGCGSETWLPSRLVWVNIQGLPTWTEIQKPGSAPTGTRDAKL